jgi:hypothetical protein
VPAHYISEGNMLVSNTKIEPLRDLFERLNFLNGLLLNLQLQLKMSKYSIEKAIDKNNFEVANLYAGFCLPIRDLTLIPDKGFFSGNYLTGIFVTQGEEYIRVIDSLLSREALWATSQAYEAFETFLLDQYGYYLLANPKCVDTKKYHKVKPKLEKDRLTPDKKEFWISFTRLSRYDYLEVMQIFRSLSPELAEIEKTNSYQIDLSEWNGVVTEVRHAVTHSNMVIKGERITEWSLAKIQILHTFFPGNAITKGYELNIKVEDAEKSLQIFGSYGYIIYKLLNGLSGVIMEVLK